MRRAVGILAVAVLVAAPTDAAEDRVTIEPVEAWTNVFGGATVGRSFRVKAEGAFAGRVGWRYQIGGGTLASGESEVRVSPGRPATIVLRFEAPPVKDGAIASSTLEVVAFEGGRTVARIEQAVAVFPKDPFADRSGWLKGLNLALFDPAGATARVFEAAGIPFEALRDPDAIGAAERGVVVVGEGVAWDDERGLAGAVVKAAGRGRPVLALAPASGRLALPGLGGPPLGGPRRVSWRRLDVISDFDKRLDAAAWPVDGKVAACSFLARPDGGDLAGEVAAAGVGWPWIEAEFPEGRGRLIFCGFGVVSHWEGGPAPRFLLARIFGRLAGETPDRPHLEPRIDR